MRKPIDLSWRAPRWWSGCSPERAGHLSALTGASIAAISSSAASWSKGLIGRVELVQMVCRASSMPPLDYLRSSGGQMRDQAIHFFDLLRFLTGDEVRTVAAAMGAALALPDIAEFGDVDTSILMMQMRGGALAQLDNTRRTGHGYDERITLLGAEGALESGSQSPAGPTLWRGNQRIEPGLWPDWFSRVQGSGITSILTPLFAP